MAIVNPTQTIISDLGSEEVKLLRLCLNALLDAIGGAADVAAIQTAMAANPAIKKLVASRELPAAPQFPSV